MSLLLLQPVGDGPVFLRHAKWHDLDSVFGLTCVSALLSYQKILEFTRQELLVYLSKNLFPGTHDSSNLYLMNGAARVQTYICCARRDAGTSLEFCIQPYSCQGKYSYKFPDGTCMELDRLQVMPPNPEMFLSLWAFRMLGLCIFCAVINSLEAFESPQAPDALISCGSLWREWCVSWFH